jgi:hypothetical protein
MKTTLDRQSGLDAGSAPQQATVPAFFQDGNPNPQSLV